MLLFAPNGNCGKVCTRQRGKTQMEEPLTQIALPVKDGYAILRPHFRLTLKPKVCIAALLFLCCLIWNTISNFNGFFSGTKTQPTFFKLNKSTFAQTLYKERSPFVSGSFFFFSYILSFKFTWLATKQQQVKYVSMPTQYKLHKISPPNYCISPLQHFTIWMLLSAWDKGLIVTYALNYWNCLLIIL